MQDISDDLAVVEEELQRYARDSDTLLGEASGHLVAAGGKRLRPAFVMLSGRMFKGARERLVPLAAAIELIHMATLVHDDVIDEADTRRKLPTVRAEWGDAVALDTGDYLFAQALTIIARYGSEQICRIMAEVSLSMCQGEIEQIESAGKITRDVRVYLGRIKKKTALLISSCCLIGGLAAGADPGSLRRLQHYGHCLGMAFQITDDILDFEGSEDVFGKPVGNDLRQGIITLPVIYALGDQQRGPLLASMISKPATGRMSGEESDWNAKLMLVKQSGALDQARDLANRYLVKARQHLAHLPKGTERRILFEVTDFVQKRDF